MAILHIAGTHNFPLEPYSLNGSIVLSYTCKSKYPNALVHQNSKSAAQQPPAFRNPTLSPKGTTHLEPEYSPQREPQQPLPNLNHKVNRAFAYSCPIWMGNSSNSPQVPKYTR